MKKSVALLASALLCMTSAFGLAACGEENKGAYDYGDINMSSIYDDLYDGMYDKYDQTDGKISLPTAGTYYTADEVTVKLDKVEYETLYYKSIGVCYTDFRIYCTVTSGSGRASLRAKYYDRDGYLMETYITSCDGEVAEGDKIIFTYAYAMEEHSENYLLGGYRLALESIE